MTHLELFSGIGGFRRALDLLTQDGIMPFECVGYSEIDSKAKLTYQSNYNVEGEVDMGDIVAFTANPNNIEGLPDFDLLTGGFPCQTFSVMGDQAGFNDFKERLAIFSGQQCRHFTSQTSAICLIGKCKEPL